MQPLTPSQTALRAARARAEHQRLDPERLVDDPVSPRLVAACGPAGAATGRADRFIARAFRGGIVARSRIAEDTLAQAVARGVRQYVVLGAGLDTFALRNPHAGLRVFEVDHPATQQAKRQLLAAAGVQAPASTAFVPLDFEHGALEGALTAAGWDRAQPTFFSWLGVVWYLEREAVLSTLRAIGRCPPGSGVVFDCWHPPHALDWAGRLKLALLRRRYARLGEPWRTLFDPAELPALLAAAGLAQASRLDSHGINRALFAGRSHRHLRLRGGRLFSVNTAWV